VRQATQADASESRRFRRAQSVWRRSFRRVRAPVTTCDRGVFFPGAALEARSGVIRPRMYGVGGLNSGSCRPIGGVTLGRPWLNRDGSHLGRVKQGLRSQVGVTLGHARLGVPKEVLDHVKRHALVHQEAGEGMAQIMQSDVSQAGTAPDAVPWTEQTGELRWEDVGARRISPATCSPVDVKDKSSGVSGQRGFLESPRSSPCRAVSTSRHRQGRPPALGAA
jgi:hypothetical protein